MPTATITAPIEGSVVSGKGITLAADAADNVAVAGVQFTIDGGDLGSEDASAPYSLTWDSNSVANGAHSIGAMARDTAGNTVTAFPVNIIVDNIVAPPPSTVLFSPSDDTYADSRNPTLSQGIKTTLLVDGSPIYITYIKFDLSSLAGRAINSAKLRVKVADKSNSTQVVKRVDDNSWSETTLTYSSRPALGVTVASLPGLKSVGSIIEIDITAEAAAKAGQIMSLGIDSTGTDGFDVYSKENATGKPELEVTAW